MFSIYREITVLYTTVPAEQVRTEEEQKAAAALGAHPVRGNIWSRWFPQSVITTHRDM